MTNQQIQWSDLKDLVKSRPDAKFLLVTGGKSFESTGAKEKISALLHNNRVERFYDFEANPKLDDAIKGIKIARRYKPDYVLALGGGSVIDMAKLITVFAAQNTDNFEGLANGSLKPVQTPQPLICIPTTFGTGSESTHFAVVYIKGAKYSFASPHALPTSYILDFSLAKSASKYLLACAGFDALCQSIESFWSRSATQESKNYAKRALEYLWPNIEDACLNKTDTSLEAMSIGANLAGKAINISKTTAPHALSYYLTSHFNIPHGHAVAICFPKFFSLNYGDGVPRSLKADMQVLFQILGVETGVQAEKTFVALMHRLGLKSDLSEWGLVRKKQYEDIVNSVNMERLENHPFELSRQNLLEALK